MKNTNLQNRLKKIFDKYNKKNGGDWLEGNFIPPEEREKYRIMFIGQKPADFFVKYGHLKYLGKCLKDFGNYNVTFIDMGFQGFLRRHNLGKVYVTDMVKTEGGAGADFETEWRDNSDFKKCLKEEIDCYKPQIIVLMSRKVVDIFNKSFDESDVKYKRYYPFHLPAALCMNPQNASVKWYEQFEEILKQLK